MKKRTEKEFIIKAIEIHGDKYDYNKIKYINNNTKLTIICPEHGEFTKIPVHHLNRKQGCPICSLTEQSIRQKKTLSDFIQESNLIHNNKFDYSKVIYKTTKNKVTIICPTHGEFNQTPDNHLSGRGCKYCGGTSKLDHDKFLMNLKEIYNDTLDYSEVVYKNMLSDIKVICPKHGEFTQTANNLLNKKRGCPYCDSIRVFDTKSFIDKAISIHGDKYDYSETVFNSLHDKLNIICPEHGLINVTPNYHLKYFGCKKCSNSTSIGEQEVKDFITSLKINLISNSKDVIKPLELDVYVPSHNVAIEYNGLYWHSELYQDKDYHLNKTNMCEEKDIQLIHIFEDEWLFKKDIVKSRLKNILGLTDKRIYGRKCEIKEVPTNIKTKFLNDNHIQGAVGSKYNIGLYHNDELVSIMTFGKRPVFNSYEYELIRFCNKLDVTVIGGASKLLKYFIKTYEPKEIISYADRRWSTGNLYDNLSFDFIEDTQPNWFIINNGIREHRVKYQKHKLVEHGYDKDNTAHQICLDNGLYRIYDCGTKKYVLKLI